MKKKLLLFALLTLMVAFAFGCAGGPKWQDGTYTGVGEGLQDDITVSVSIEDGKIAAVEVVEHRESPGVSEPALEQIPEIIVENQSAEVDVVAGVTYTSDGIMQAVSDALSKAE
ncbi:FMN-binding protein [Alkalibacter rhizosphaerae]|uniref:FMN-binding protein n=1 Tax=Alkalibacter rhizosphaerae TaxID=2815577 RepID=A0A974XG10_9FIRM|nr:FMN-binding protein [Alkalibacter rhizosphaerae]QSX09179.1 FMN-binding protein [Alkalibacter rhizosphaerae]